MRGIYRISPLTQAELDNHQRQPRPDNHQRQAHRQQQQQQTCADTRGPSSWPASIWTGHQYAATTGVTQKLSLGSLITLRPCRCHRRASALRSASVMTLTRWTTTPTTTKTWTTRVRRPSLRLALACLSPTLICRLCLLFLRPTSLSPPPRPLCPFSRHPHRGLPHLSSLSPPSKADLLPRLTCPPPNPIRRLRLLSRPTSLFNPPRQPYPFSHPHRA